MSLTSHIAGLTPFCLVVASLALSATLADAAPQEPASGKAAIRSVPFTAVTLKDSFWAPKRKVYRERTIPHSWQSVTREIEDNEIAAGWKGKLYRPWR